MTTKMMADVFWEAANVHRIFVLKGDGMDAMNDRLQRALRELIARYEYDGVPNDSLPALENARSLLTEGEVRGSVFGEVVVTRNAAGAIVLVARQDADGQVLSVIAEAGKWGVRKLGVGMSAGECIVFDTRAEAEAQATEYGGDVVPLTYEDGRWACP